MPACGLTLWSIIPARAQSDTLLFTPVSGYAYAAPYSAYTAHFDRLGRPFIYTANKEYGVVLFDYSDLQNIKPAHVFPVPDFQNLKPTDLVQQGQYLYVSLGDFNGLPPQRAGLAVLDVSDPYSATLVGQWDSTTFNKGSAAVRVDGDYAYLGAMDKGVIVLDISNPIQPEFVSHLDLDLDWPVPPGLFSVPHARGLALRGDELWVCFDAGGLRLVDLSDRKNPKESSKYINSDLDAVAQPAYNTAAIAGNYLFAAVDYCGLDVVEISDPLHPQNAAWQNPWNCTNTSWDGSPGHTNQVATACHDSLLFLSGGDSELLAYSISDPGHPRQVGQWAMLKDSAATWGVDANDSLVVLAQIWNPLNTPYIAKKGGIQLLRWHCPQLTSSQQARPEDFGFTVSPNPARGIAQVQYFLPAAGGVHWAVYNSMGQRVLQRDWTRQEAGPKTDFLDMGILPSGIYSVVLRIDSRCFHQFISKL